MGRNVNATAEYDERKFRELVLYISQRYAHDPKFGATKLNKALYFSDFLAYANLGSAITGVEYQKLPNGPGPRRMVPIRDEMVARGELGIQPVLLKGGKIQHRTVNLRAPDLSVFSPEEIALIDSVLAALENADAETVSNISHRMIGWKVAKEKQTIPYETIFVSDVPLTAIDRQRAVEVAAELGLTA